MRLEQLYYFEIISQEGSFNKAAAKLHIAQPSLTASMKSLEKELNKTLLTRTSHGLALTEDGKIVLAFCKDVLARYKILRQDLYGISEQPVGNFSIIAPKFFSQFILEPFQRNFLEKYEQISLRIIENDYHATAQQLSSTSCKFAITTHMISDDNEKCAPGMLASGTSLFDDRYHYLPLFQDVFGFCTSKNCPLSNLTPIYPITLSESNYPLTLFPFGQVIISDHVLLSSSNYDLHIKAMLKENAYCSIPYFVYKQIFSQDDRLTFRAFSNNVLLTWHLIYPTNYTITPAEQIFINELQNYLSEMKFK